MTPSAKLALPDGDTAPVTDAEFASSSMILQWWQRFWTVMLPRMQDPPASCPVTPRHPTDAAARSFDQGVSDMAMAHQVPDDARLNATPGTHRDRTGSVPKRNGRTGRLIAASVVLRRGIPISFCDICAPRHLERAQPSQLSQVFRVYAFRRQGAAAPRVC